MGLVGAFDHPAFFAEETIARPRAQQFLKQRLLGLEIGGRHVVGGALAGDLELGDLAEVPRQRPAGLAAASIITRTSALGVVTEPLVGPGAGIHPFRSRPGSVRPPPCREGFMILMPLEALAGLYDEEAVWPFTVGSVSTTSRTTFSGSSIPIGRSS